MAGFQDVSDACAFSCWPSAECYVIAGFQLVSSAAVLLPDGHVLSVTQRLDFSW
jgi:hypothetical protein